MLPYIRAEIGLDLPFQKRYRRVWSLPDSPVLEDILKKRLFYKMFTKWAKQPCRT